MSTPNLVFVVMGTDPIGKNHVCEAIIGSTHEVVKQFGIERRVGHWQGDPEQPPTVVITAPTTVAIVDDYTCGSERLQLSQLSRLLLDISRGVNAFVIVIPPNDTDIGPLLDSQLGLLSKIFNHLLPTTAARSWFHNIVLVFEREEDPAIIARVQKSLGEQNLSLRETMSGAELSFVVVHDRVNLSGNAIREAYRPLLTVLQSKKRWTCLLLDEVSSIDVMHADDGSDDGVIDEINTLLLSIIGTASAQPLVYGCCIQ